MNTDEITSGMMSSPADLIDLEESLVASDPDKNPTAFWAFRGQTRGFQTLVPSLQRKFEKKKSIGTAQIIEADLVKAFRKHYTKLNPQLNQMPAPEQIADGFDLRCLSVMQHYGVPTRLLDWTSNFWTAIYFACANDPGLDGELWFYDRRIFWDSLGRDPQVAAQFQPLGVPVPDLPALPPVEPGLLSTRNRQMILELNPQFTPRMKEQAAHHTVSTDIFADHAPLILQLAKEVNPEGFRRVVITSGCKEKALRFLEEKGVTAGSIFPDVEGLGKFLNWHLDSLITMLL